MRKTFSEGTSCIMPVIKWWVIILITGLDGTTTKLAEVKQNLPHFKCPHHEIFYTRINHLINQMENRKTSPEAIHDPS
jgi:hypothetical protein